MKTIIKTLAMATLLLSTLVSCGQSTKKQPKMESKNQANLATATFGTGCFWCTEAVFQEIEGVESVVSGYSGGFVENPTYKAVCTGQTGHAECLQIKYDSTKIDFHTLLGAFFASHDPTTKDRQGNDSGPQYRSVVFYHNAEQKAETEKAIADLTAEKAFSNPIVTEVAKFEKFYAAEDYHQNYYNDNTFQPYCAMIIRPKLDKFRKVFKDKLKTH
jgi:peptide-methionine (S)-S-oxide reductase